MYGEISACVFLVFSNAGPEGEEALARWYNEMHGPDAFKGGSFHALHRYRATGPYDARFLAVWEGDYASIDEVRAKMLPGSSGLRDRGRITTNLIVVWSSFNFLAGAEVLDPASPVATLTLVEGGPVDGTGVNAYDYGGVVLYESPDEPATVAARWSGRAAEGVAPHGPYSNIFDHPEDWPPKGQPLTEPWVSHWRPISSLRRSDVQPET
jgi:hypothetical protein